MKCLRRGSNKSIQESIQMNEQDKIREPFLGYSGSFEKMIVHGHTPTSNGLPEMRRNRVNLDTGAFATDRLSAVHIAADETAFGFLAAVGSSNEAVQVQGCMPTLD